MGLDTVYQNLKFRTQDSLFQEKSLRFLEETYIYLYNLRTK